MADLNALIIFAKVAEAKGFSAAARRLAMPVSTVSRRIAELEEQLSVRLLERSTRVLPKWRFRRFDLSLVHLGTRHVSRPARMFKELAAALAPELFPNLPT